MTSDLTLSRSESEFDNWIKLQLFFLIFRQWKSLKLFRLFASKFQCILNRLFWKIIERRMHLFFHHLHFVTHLNLSLLSSNSSWRKSALRTSKHQHFHLICHWHQLIQDQWISMSQFCKSLTAFQYSLTLKFQCRSFWCFLSITYNEKKFLSSNYDVRLFFVKLIYFRFFVLFSRLLIVSFLITLILFFFVVVDYEKNSFYALIFWVCLFFGSWLVWVDFNIFILGVHTSVIVERVKSLF